MKRIRRGLSFDSATFGGGTRVTVFNVFARKGTGTPCVSVRFSAPHLKPRAMSVASFLDSFAKDMK